PRSTQPTSSAASDVYKRQALKPEVKKALQLIDQLYGYYDPELLGFIGVQQDKVEMLFVANQARGKGIGKKLLQFALDSLNIHYVDCLINTSDPDDQDGCVDI
ncbi:GNAT family N-acetyltransferase, partial [Enterococcus sp. S181_ASV_20]|nr:GNAT family N-acetyltransferase [Enterococcus sp. S181_ASV_20]